VADEALIIIETPSSTSPSGMFITKTAVGDEEEASIIIKAKELIQPLT
jgi:hypothetical protein